MTERTTDDAVQAMEPAETADEPMPSAIEDTIATDEP